MVAPLPCARFSRHCNQRCASCSTTVDRRSTGKARRVSHLRLEFGSAAVQVAEDLSAILRDAPDDVGPPVAPSSGLALAGDAPAAPAQP